ncbi:MAG: hypothetical protein U0930_13065 [Pirellulales bacterium]
MNTSRYGKGLDSTQVCLRVLQEIVWCRNPRFRVDVVRLFVVFDIGD